MAATNDRFWAKVLFKEFIRHYRKLSAEQRAADIDASMDALEDLDASGDSFGSKMVRWSMQRADEAAAKASAANGKKGGRPKKSPQDAPNGNAGEDLSTAGNRDALEPPTSCDPLTADGDIREDSQDMHRARKGGTLESGTSANLYALDGLAGKDRQPRALGTHAKSRGARVPEIPDQEDLYEQVAAEGLDEFDARQWFDMCNDRRWLDRDGNPIANWKGALKRFCDAKARRRGKETEG